MVLVWASKGLKRFEIYSISHIFRLFSTHFVFSPKNRFSEKSIHRKIGNNSEPISILNKKINVTKNAVTEKSEFEIF